MDCLARCPGCNAGLPIHASNAPELITCGNCGKEIPLAISPALRADEAVDKCPVCSGGDFYTRKDFNPKIGVTIVVIGASISAIFYWFKRDFIAYGILAFATLIDLFIYGRLKEVTVCYRCHSEFRGSYKHSAPAFDLHTADVLELEYERRIGRR
jgi:hypothetical protein